MSKFKEKSEYAAMRVSGFLGWIHRVVMLITFPIRKFWTILVVLLVILAVLMIIPMYYGIRYYDVWDWYMVKMPTHEFVEAKDKAIFGVENKIDEVKRTFNEIAPRKKVTPAADKKKKENKVEFVAWNVAEFRKARYKPQTRQPVAEKIQKIKDEVLNWQASEVVEQKVPAKEAADLSPVEEAAVVTEQETVSADNAPDTSSATENVVAEENNPVAENVYVETNEQPVEKTPDAEIVETISANQEEQVSENVPEIVSEDTVLNEESSEFAREVAESVTPKAGYNGNIEDYYIELPNPDLEYLPQPEIWEGKVDVIGANSLYINGKFAFLYGVFSNPDEYDTEAAADYLRHATQDRNVYCVVLAYSKRTHSATALCFVDGVLLNKILVEYNLAENKALK